MTLPPRPPFPRAAPGATSFPRRLPRPPIVLNAGALANLQGHGSPLNLEAAPRPRLTRPPSSPHVQPGARKARTSATFADGTKKKRLPVLNLADVDKPERPERRSSLSGASFASAAFASKVFSTSLARHSLSTTTSPNADGALKLNRWGSLLRRHRQSLDGAEPAAPGEGEGEPASPTSPPSPNKDPRRLVRTRSMPTNVPGNVPGDVPAAADAATPNLARSATTSVARSASATAAGSAPGSPSKEKAKESPGSSTTWDKIVHGRLLNKTTSITNKVHATFLRVVKGLETEQIKDQKRLRFVDDIYKAQGNHDPDYFSPLQRRPEKHAGARLRAAREEEEDAAAAAADERRRGASGGGAGGRDGGGGAGDGAVGVSEVTPSTSGAGGARGAAEEGGTVPARVQAFARAGSSVAFLPKTDEPASGRLGDRVADYLEEVEPATSCSKCPSTRLKPEVIECDATLSCVE